MKKKPTTLLNEASIRKFMKLANLSKLTESFVEGLEDEEELPPEGDESELPPEAPVGEPEVPMGDEPEGGMAGVDEETVERLVDAIADALEAETGIAIDVSGEAGEEMPEPEGEMEPEGDLGAPPAQELGPPEGEEEEEAPIMEGGLEVEEPPVSEGKETNFGGTKDAKLTAAKKPESAIKAAQSKAGVVSESKSAKEKLIAEITNRVVARLKAETAKPTKKGKR